MREMIIRASKTYWLTFFCIIILLTFGIGIGAVLDYATTPEVLTWSRTDEEPPEAVWYYDGEITHRYTLNTPEESEITIETGEARIIYGDPWSELEIEPEPNEPMKYSLPIPTWPDYIELEKDLILRFDYPEPNNLLMKLIHEPTAYRIFSKGTKIYFKGDE